MQNTPLRYILTALFSLGAIALLGILSYSGMLYLTGNVIASLVSAGLAVLIEGEIYKRNILSGVSKFLEFGQFVERDSYVNKLKELSDKFHDPKSADCDNSGRTSLLKDYYSLRHYKKKLEHAKVRSEEQEKELERCETRISEIEEFFIRYMNDGLDPNNIIEQRLSKGLDHYLINDKTEILNTLRSNISWEQMWLWLSTPFTVGGGIMAMLVAVAQLPEALVALNIAITPTLTMLAIWPLAFLGGIGLMLITYNTFVEVIHNKKWVKHWKVFNQNIKEASTLGSVLHVVSMALITGLAIFATIATASTWWIAAQTGVTLFPLLSTLTVRLQMILISVGATLFALGQIVFEYVNSLESHATITRGQSRKGLTKDQEQYLSKLSTVRQFFAVPLLQALNDYDSWLRKPLCERINPFTWIIKIIEYPFRLVIFIGHLISIGVTGDRLGNIHPAVTSTVGALQEGMTDLHYVWSGKCGHHHYDFAGLFLDVLLSPLKLLATGWNFISGEKDFSEQLRKTFGRGKIKEIKKYVPSAELQHYEVDKIIAQEEERLDNVTVYDESAEEKLQLWRNARAISQKATPISVPDNKSLENKSVLFSQEDLATLQKHRSAWLGSSTTKSMQTFDKIQQEFPHFQLVKA